MVASILLTTFYRLTLAEFESPLSKIFLVDFVLTIVLDKMMSEGLTLVPKKNKLKQGIMEDRIYGGETSSPALLN